jgi:uncharacterized SAM-binding protein YcdF (DUF218 family)
MNTRGPYYKYLKSKIFIGALALVMFFAAVIFLFRHAGDYLVVKHVPYRADGIFIFMGSIGDRASEAYELFKEGYSDKILLVEDHEIGRQSLKKRGIHLPNDADEIKAILTSLGVPDSLINIIPGDAQSTKEEAIQVKAYIQNNPQVDTILLVTSASHSRRAILYIRNILRDLPHPVMIFSCPSRYSEFKADRWWVDRSSAKQVAYEYSRLAYFFFWDRF